jgi:two-component system chemotaxis response regulator CheB
MAPFAALVVIGSQGATESFHAMLGDFPASFPAAVVFDLHRSGLYDLTEHVIQHRCGLPVQLAQDGVKLEPGRVYLAPHDRQLVIGEGQRLQILGSVNGVGHRFADGLLASGARELGPRLIAVVLSGRLAGGAEGVREVKRRGGRVLVEDPRSAIAPGMPNAALATGCVDYALPAERLGHALLALCAATGGAELFRIRINAGVSS